MYTYYIMAMYPIKLSFMIQILLVFTCEIQTTNANESQRNLLRENFQKVLMNDSEQLLTLQQIFLTPRQKNPDGLYLDVDVTVEGRITNDDDDSYWIHENCDSYCPQNNSWHCIYHTSMTFEILPPTLNQDSTVQTFVNTYYIKMVLLVLDPSFHSLARMFQTSDDSYAIASLIFYTYVDKVELIMLPEDVCDALYLTLSWVSLKQCNLHHNLLNLIIIILL